MNRLVAASAVCVACAVGAGVARQAPQQTPPKFRTGVNLVVVDVSVLDERRLPVRGLTAADFTVLEDGKPQPIATFSAIDVPDVEAPSATWMQDVAPDVQRNDEQAGRRLMVVVLDDATPMPMADVPRVRDMARRVIDRLGPVDLAAVVYVLNKKKGQEFTSDRRRLLQALDHFTGGIAEKGRPWDAFDATALTMYQATLGTVQGVVESLIDLPERRKAVVFVSVGLPVDGEAVEPSAGIGDGTVHKRGAAADVISQTFDIFRAAQRANVNIYGLDPGGLRAPYSPKSRDFLDPGKLNREFLQAISENTGGLAIVQTNDPEPGIVQMFRENGSYYLLGYEAPNPESQGRYRRIDVRVNRPGVTVRGRRGYLEPRRVAPAKAGAKPVEPPSPVLNAMARVVPKTDIALRATVAPFALPGQSKAALAIVLQMELTPPAATTRVVDDVDVQIRAYDTSGRLAGSGAAQVRVPFRPGMQGSVAYEVLSQVDLKPGTYHLRLSASSSLQGRSGSVHYDLDVPDFSKGPLVLSGAVISVTPDVSSGPRGRLASLLPVVPTTQRDFPAGDKVTAFLRVDQPGRQALVPVLIKARIRDGRDVEVFTGSEKLEPERFASARSADYALSLPLAALPEGPYLLTLEAAPAPAPSGGTRDDSAKPIRRDVRFTLW